MAQLDSNNSIERSSDPLIEEALTTEAEFVETFRYSDMQPDDDNSLIYSFRVTETNDPGSTPLSVLCLCFRFENELDGVFQHLTEEGDWSVMMLLDREGTVIASSDRHHVPLNARMELVLDQDHKVVSFAGRPYLAKTCATQGYQGFMGLGWHGHVMISLDRAFDCDANHSERDFDARVLDAVMGNSRLFSEKRQSIPRDAERIQRELDRTVWNGNVREEGAEGEAATSSAKVLLREISKTGAKTKLVFERSIGNLHETVVSSILTDVEFLASLAIDIMDRNLYERANNCRWWALTSAFREILSKPRVSPEDTQKTADILQYINGLYTVYTNLFVYDRDGTVLAVANASEKSIVGRKLDTSWVRATLDIRDSQKYSVSPFSKTDLYGDQHTYIYGASITHPDNSRDVLGVIGIVFDSAQKFEAMLKDALPRDNKGNVISGGFALFADSAAKVIATTNPDLAVGETLDFDADLFSLRDGEGVSRVVEYQGRHFAVGARSSEGYREYKSESDDYCNDVIGLVFVTLGEVTDEHRSRSRHSAVGSNVSGMGGATGTDRVEIATFYIGDAWLGVAATSVVEAISVKGLTKIPGANECLAGTILFRDDVIPVLMPHAELEVEVDLHNENAQIVVTQSDSGKVGIIVDRLGEIPEVSHDQINSEHNWWKGDDSYIESFIKPPPESDWEGLLVVLDPTRLLQSRLLARGVSISNILGEQNDGVSAELHDAVESGSAIG